MIHFTGALLNLKFDVDTYRKTLDEALQTQLRQAARAWLRAVIPLVPVYTGMARGTLAPLGRFLKIAVPIDPVAIRQNKSPSLGAARSDFEFAASGGVYDFQWIQDVLHYTINEYNDMSGILPLKNPTPWHSIAAGNNAFDRYVREVLPGKLPKLGHFIHLETSTIH